MTQWHWESSRTPAGGINTHKRHGDKKLSQKGGNPTHTRLGAANETIVQKGRGQTQKIKTRVVQSIHVLDQKSKKVVNAALKTVVRNDANRQFARQNILTKGAIVRVSDGKTERLAQITNRPGQTGGVHAKFVEEKNE